MKKYLLPLAVAAFGSSLTASALDAEHVRVSFKAKGPDLKVETINTPLPAVDVFSTKRNEGSAPWYCIRIPLTVEGIAKNNPTGKGPNFVDELKVHVYAVFTAGKGETPILLDKEVTYVEIPLSPSNSADKPSKGEMNAAVFISPSNASKILGDPSKIDFGNKLAAVAVEVTYKDSPCIKDEGEQAVVISHDMDSKLNGKWWKKNSNNKTGAVLNAISETPFAPFYAPAFPATSPLYGPAMGGVPGPGTGSSSSGSTYPSSSSSTSTADDTTAADTTDDSATEDTGKKKGKKNKKNK